MSIIIPDNSLATQISSVYNNKEASANLARINQQISNIKTENDKFNAELKKAAVDLESLHISQILKQMRASSDPQDDLFGDSLTKEFFTSALDGEYAKLMAESGGIGIAKMIIENNKRT